MATIKELYEGIDLSEYSIKEIQDSKKLYNYIVESAEIAKEENKELGDVLDEGILGMLAGGVIGATAGTIRGTIIAIYIEPIRKFFQWLTGRDLFPAELYYLSELPSKVEFWTVFGIALIAIVLAFLATLYPAWKAANTDPVEVLRNE